MNDKVSTQVQDVHATLTSGSSNLLIFHIFYDHNKFQSRIFSN